MLRSFVAMSSRRARSNRLPLWTAVLALSVSAAALALSISRVLARGRMSHAPLSSTLDSMPVGPLPQAPDSVDAEARPAAPNNTERAAPSSASTQVLYQRWLIVLLVLTSVVVPLFMQPPYSTMLFVPLLALTLAVGVRASRPALQQTIGEAVAPIARIAAPVTRPLAHEARRIAAAHAAAVYRLCLLAVYLLLIWCALIVQPGAAVDEWLQFTLNRAVAVLALGVLLLNGALRFVTLPPLPTIAATALTPRRARKLPLLLGALLLWLLAEINGSVFDLPFLQKVSHHTQFVLLVVGMALLVWGLGGVTLMRALVGTWQALARLDRARWLTVLAMLAITALALFLRMWRLEDAIHSFVDEVNFSAVVQHFWSGDPITLLPPRVMSFPGMYSYWQSISVDLFGRNLTGLRAISALLGTLTVPGIYLLGSALFNRKTGLTAALLLATFPVHIHFSRLGMNNIADPLFATWGFAFIARGLRYNRRVDHALGGALFGMTQYFYEGGRLFYPPLLVLWCGALVALGWSLVKRDPKTGYLTLTESAKGLTVAALAALLVAMPIYYTLIGIQSSIAPRFGEMGLKKPFWDKILTPDGFIDYLTRMRQPLRMFISLPEDSLFYMGGQPFVLAYVAPAFLLGVVYVPLRALRQRAQGVTIGILPLTWLLVTVFAISMLEITTHAPRYVVVFPAIALTAALGLCYGIDLLFASVGRSALTRNPSPSGRETIPPFSLREKGKGVEGKEWIRLLPQLQTVLVAVLALVFAVGQATYYFGPHLTRFNQDFRLASWAPDGQDAVLRSLDFPARTQIHLVSKWEYDAGYARAVLGFFRGDLEVDSLTVEQFTDRYLDSLPRDVDHAFYLEPDNLAILQRVRDHFTVEQPRFTPYEVPRAKAFILYYAPAALNRGRDDD